MIMEWGRRTRCVFVWSELEVEYCLDHAGACVLQRGGKGNEFVRNNVWICRTHTSGLSLWLVKAVSMTAPEAVEVDCLQHSQFACTAGSHID